MQRTGALDQYEREDVTPIIGTEFPKAKLTDWIKAPNADELLRDLAILISERGVVFFRAQDGLSNTDQKELMQRLGELTGKPPTSRLSIHPIFEQGDNDPEINTISAAQDNKLRSIDYSVSIPKKQSSAHWHSDVAFEPVPAEYTTLRLTEVPKTGGDTLWASGYELYDRISKPYQRFLETLTATCAQPGYNKVAATGKFKLFDGQRGAPENVGSNFSSIHPVVRTNPVTGWKSIYSAGFHVQKINGVTESESKALLDWFLRLINENNDLQVRFKWRNANDMAIWDNRCVFHTATFDLEGREDRYGVRAVGVGEKPYFDANSKSRREALGEPVEAL
ncbi:alpha-ketoglutarate-dependent taurine dioxygenase [Arthroderma uncinatum]|uniref:alpha-ketoglutarate-dependent taurine dioxygenase n=1 Tax=Arthroderma uncinatum TaxID=74035 RepID=UPI00144A95BF|nr:alpha-ketoglutarate-dependent taurine dioxygenase [Arthroderma uncinatum]KAF3479442.1 alpha-ketoglutarate-dependent taurine dioxygenase [Arthroderma uncinatum]